MGSYQAACSGSTSGSSSDPSGRGESEIRIAASTQTTKRKPALGCSGSLDTSLPPLQLSLLLQDLSSTSLENPLFFALLQPFHLNHLSLTSLHVETSLRVYILTPSHIHHNSLFLYLSFYLHPLCGRRLLFSHLFT